MMSTSLGFGPMGLIPKRIRTSSSSFSSRAMSSSSFRWAGSKDNVVKLSQQKLVNNNIELTTTTPPLPLLGNNGMIPLNQQALFLFTLIASTASISFISLVIAAVPTLRAMRRTAISLSKLADTARHETPPTMAAIRLSTLELTDLTLQFNDLSQQVADGVNKSAQAVQAAEAGIRQLASHARHQTMSMIEERANLPNISIQPLVAGAAKKTSRAVGQATKTLFNFISTSNGNPVDRIDK